MIKVLSLMKKLSNDIKNNCLLLLENNSLFFGRGFGLNGTYVGELCFNTSITGYQEILTDPSYKNQIIAFTFPHIGIVGTNSFDHESNMIHASGCIVNNPIGKPSNYRSELYFEDWLIKNKKVCITGIDTRTLTRKIRKQGVFKALIHKFDHEEFSIPILKKKIQSLSPMKDLDLASSVSTNKIYQWKNNNKKLLTNENEILGNFIAVIDFGVKRNILNILEGLGYKIIVFPISYDYEKLISRKPVGIFLSNGPGDPKATYKKIESKFQYFIQSNIPIFGICLGHQILALSNGAKTVKMHHGHRGANHPIKNLKNDSVEITVQNHGFVVSKKNLPLNIDITHISLFDKTIAGIETKDKPHFSVQYHPEASPGPHDSGYLFDKFKKNILIYAKKN
tara:strand:- start:391 stop:1572 length:1182 start_codon:yes stop_codon:yes gene_type:complete